MYDDIDRQFLSYSPFMEQVMTILPTVYCYERIVSLILKLPIYV